jgi:hypothetical protein
MKKRSKYAEYCRRGNEGNFYRQLIKALSERLEKQISGEEVFGPTVCCNLI